MPVFDENTPLNPQGRLAGKVAQMLEGHGVALLRHDRGDLHEGVRQVELPHLEARPELKILDRAAEMQEHQLQRAVDRGHVVDRRDAGLCACRVEAL